MAPQRSDHAGRSQQTTAEVIVRGMPLAAYCAARRLQEIDVIMLQLTSDSRRPALPVACGTVQFQRIRRAWEISGTSNHSDSCSPIALHTTPGAVTKASALLPHAIID